ncbi:Clr5 domain-containing protein [Truncatella angustata]|uniref:Clr5 domain-containing protein n=1 Tax=Truncatella angustata TaxID=152316 RepID=A0A9P8ULH1_9PEZI|nr:Clr5 domain-containing protein [Truncatella angustata]KAH6654293.1 Clr5 domain-containing protein [Truncatella angustata]
MAFIVEQCKPAVRETGPLQDVPIREPQKSGSALLHHEEDEWEAMRSLIQQIYIREDRTLRELMLEMDRGHGFKATLRMYKTHFRRWEFRKYKERTLAKQRSGPEKCIPAWGSAGSLTPLTPHVADIPEHRRTLSIFHVVSTFNESRLECFAFTSGVPRNSLEPTPLGTFYPIESQEAYGLFQFSAALYRRHHGRLAGKAVRKAFIHAEKAVSALDVHFMWNFLDIMYGMLLRGQEELLRIFLGHIAALGFRVLPVDHPVARVFRVLAESTDEERTAVITQAWRCTYDIMQRRLDPWCSVVDEIDKMGSEDVGYGDTDHDIPTNFLVVKGVASDIQDREAIGLTNLAPNITTNVSPEREFRQLRIKYNTIIGVIELLGPAHLTKDELLMEPFSLHQRLELKAWGDALKGRCNQHLAHQQYDQARACNDQIRQAAIKYAATGAYSNVRYLQHLCTMEDRFCQAGDVEYAKEIGADMLKVTEDFLKDIPDDTG